MAFGRISMMKSRSIIGLVAVGVAVLLLFAACSTRNGVSNDPQAPPSPLEPQAPATVQTSQSAPECDLGGPYIFRGGRSKVTDFEKYQKGMFFFSKGTRLEKGLFIRSVEKDQNNPDRQHPNLKYNYVVDEDKCDIYVAVWTMSAVDIKALPQTTLCNAIADLYAISGDMINI